MGQQYKDRDEDQDQDPTPAFQIPETRGTQDALSAALQAVHQQEEEEDKKAGKPKKKRAGGQICCCGNPNCGIGPMREIRGGDAEA